ncbi:MAG TPA: hypothetical protein VKO42_00255 [Patescibacteria group bacterium]|nr:hypothetical protein [Patescibacteria group bacterium]
MAKEGAEKKFKETVNAVCKPRWGHTKAPEESKVNVKVLMQWTEKFIDGKWRVQTPSVEVIKVASCPYQKSGNLCSNFDKMAIESIKSRRKKHNEGKPPKMKLPVNEWPACPVYGPLSSKRKETLTTTISNDIGSYTMNS